MIIILNVNETADVFCAGRESDFNEFFFLSFRFDEINPVVEFEYKVPTLDRRNRTILEESYYLYLISNPKF